MLKTLATHTDVQILAQYLAQALPEEAQTLLQEHPHGREVCTKAVWTCLASLRAHLGNAWSLYPTAIAKGVGKASGEYLVDFMLMDETFGPRIACESELGGIRSVEWALDKPRGVKADIKILLCDEEFDPAGSLPPTIAELARRYLAIFGHYLPSEHFLCAAQPEPMQMFSVEPAFSRAVEGSGDRLFRSRIVRLLVINQSSLRS